MRRVCMCVRVCMRVRVCVRARVRACERAPRGRVDGVCALCAAARAGLCGAGAVRNHRPVSPVGTAAAGQAGHRRASCSWRLRKRGPGDAVSLLTSQGKETGALLPSLPAQSPPNDIGPPPQPRLHVDVLRHTGEEISRCRGQRSPATRPPCPRAGFPSPLPRPSCRGRGLSAGARTALPAGGLLLCSHSQKE